MSEPISILFAGDFCSTNPSGIIVSEELKSIFQSCDLKVINFEGPLATNHFTVPNKTVLKQSDESPKWCEKNGFNIVSLANNHLLDFGQEGCRKTIDAFSSSTVIGAGNWNDAYSVKYIECKGKKLGFFSASSADLASLQDKWTETNKLGAAWINHPSVNYIIQEAKRECDYLFVIVHAGVEFMPVPLPEWRDRYKELIDLGADAVIAAHPHVVQGWEDYKGHPIFYSLGNFFFDYYNTYGKPDGWDNGLAVKISINMDGEITYTTYCTIKNNYNLSIDKSHNIYEHYDYICKILNREEDYMNEVNKQVLYFYEKYKMWLVSGLGALDMSQSIKYKIKFIIDYFRGATINHIAAMHQLREESTRWLMIRALKIRSLYNK